MGVCTSSCLNSNNKKHKDSQFSNKDNNPEQSKIREIKEAAYFIYRGLKGF